MRLKLYIRNNFRLLKWIFLLRAREILSNKKRESNVRKYVKFNVI